MINKNVKKYMMYTISDEHLSELISSYNNIVKYKTGFTGDTGKYLSCGKTGYLLVDGRFSIQARKEVYKNIKVIDINRNYDLYDFLYDRFKKEKSNILLYLDYKREPISKIKRIEKVIEKLKKNNLNSKNNILIKNFDYEKDKGYISYRKNIFHMKSCPLFLLDKSKIRIFDKSIRNELLKGADYYITSSKIEIAYLTNLRYEFCDIDNAGVLFDGYLIVGKDKIDLYIHDYIDYDIEKIFNKHNVYIKKYEDFYKDIKKIRKKVNIDRSINNYYIINCIPKKLVRLINSPLDVIMSVKSNTEISNLKKTNIIDSVCLANIIYELKNNFNDKDRRLTEYDVKEMVDNERRKNKSFLCPSFDTIVAYKENSAICHYLPEKNKSKVLKNKSILLIDSGGHYKNGTTDITRTISLYKNKNVIPKDIKRNYTLVLKSLLKLSNQKFVYGYCGRELDMVARENVLSECLDYEHGTGHGIGYVTNVHDGPNNITPGISNAKENNILEINQVQSIEPGLYFDKKYGIRIENDTYVSHYKDTVYGEFLKFNSLTLCPFDKDLIDVKFLNEKEIKYLNEYHKVVYKKLYKYFSGKKLLWLKESCKSI